MPRIEEFLEQLNLESASNILHCIYHSHLCSDGIFDLGAGWSKVFVCECIYFDASLIHVQVPIVARMESLGFLFDPMVLYAQQPSLLQCLDQLERKACKVWKSLIQTSATRVYVMKRLDFAIDKGGNLSGTLLHFLGIVWLWHNAVWITTRLWKPSKHLNSSRHRSFADRPTALCWWKMQVAGASFLLSSPKQVRTHHVLLALSPFFLLF